MGKHLNSIFALHLIIFLFLAISTSYAATKNATVVLKNGKTYEEVSVKLNNAFKVIEIKSEDGKIKKKISVTQVSSILDEDGNDITKNILGRWYNPNQVMPEKPAVEEKLEGKEVESSPPDQTTTQESTPIISEPKKQEDPPKKERWLSDDNPRVINAKKKTWNVAFKAGSGYNIPGGVWFEGVKSGIGLGGNFLIALNHKYALSFEYSKTGLYVDDDFLRFYIIEPGYSITNQTSDFSTSRYYVSFLYYKQGKANSHGLKPIYYIYTGLGMVRHQFLYEGTLVDDFTGAQAPLSMEDTVDKFSMPAGVGVIFPLSKKLGIDLGASLDYLFIQSVENNTFATSDNVQTAIVFNINLGLVYFL